MDQTPTSTQYAHIVRKPDFMSGEPSIAGHRIWVRDVVAARDLGGFTPEEIAANVYPGLTLGEVYAALAYFGDHREEIERAGREEVRSVEEFRRCHPELVHGSRPAGY